MDIMLIAILLFVTYHDLFLDSFWSVRIRIFTSYSFIILQILTLSLIGSINGYGC
jgi:hypothetical protein